MTMETFKNTVMLSLAVFVGLFVFAIAKMDNAPLSRPATHADTARRECVDEQYRALLHLTDKPWRTSELAYEARKFCDRQGIREPR
jgi:hypothetical protein